MAKKLTQPMGIRIIKSVEQRNIQKSDISTQMSGKTAYTAGDWLSPSAELTGLREMVKHSTILPQCVRAYKNNIAGFGIGVRYKEDVKETDEMEAEWDKMSEVLQRLTTEQDTKEVFEDVIEAREIYGIAYLEVIRNIGNEVEQIEFIRETPSIKKTRPLEPYIPSKYYREGIEIIRKKRYCKYKQEIGGKVVYFKEFGDPRAMDKRNGECVEDGLDLEYQANEIIEFPIGTEPYGEVRWIGQVLGVDGSRKAENLNNNYFNNGRHTPLMIIVKGGTLTEDSYDKLQGYMNDIKGEAGQHAFMILEAESEEGETGFVHSEKVDIEIKDLANILQKDELFQDYLDNNRRKAQSAFQLPDVYVGYTTDFNRATAQTAQEITEAQVFQPERKSLAWIVNNKLLSDYRFKHVEAYFLEPKISNPDDLFRLLTVANNAGGLTPNRAKQIVYEAYGETSENYPEEWGEMPLAYNRVKNGGTGFDFGALTMSLQKQIEKAAVHHDDTVMAVMKEVKKLLLKMYKGE